MNTQENSGVKVTDYTPEQAGRALPASSPSSCSRQEIPREERTNAPAAVFERLPDLLAGKADPESKEEKLHPVTAYCKAYNMGIITSKEMHELAAKWERDHSSANVKDD